jgi:hypothetical protein
LGSYNLRPQNRWPISHIDIPAQTGPAATEDRDRDDLGRINSICSMPSRAESTHRGDDLGGASKALLNVDTRHCFMPQELVF